MNKRRYAAWNVLVTCRQKINTKPTPAASTEVIGMMVSGPKYSKTGWVKNELKDRKWVGQTKAVNPVRSIFVYRHLFRFGWVEECLHGPISACF